jgi:hypothetical protein
MDVSKVRCIIALSCYRIWLNYRIRFSGILSAIMSSLSFSLSAGNWLPVGSAWPGHLPQLSGAQYQVGLTIMSFKFICTGGVSYTLYISLLISKLFCTKGCMGGGEAEPLSPYPSHPTVLQQLCRYWYRYVGMKWIYFVPLPLKISTFSGPNGTLVSPCHFTAQKSLDIQGPTLPMALEIYLPTSKSLSPAPY